MESVSQSVAGNLSDVAATTTAPVTDDDDIWPWRVGLFGIGGTCIACVGVVCNVIAIVVLAHYRSKSSAPFLLISLEVFDTLFLLTEMLLEPLTYMAQGNVITDTYRDFIRPVYCILFPVPSLARTCSAYLVVLITLERYTVVAWPLLAHRLWRPKVARLAVLGVILFNVVYHIPLYLAYTCKTIFFNATQENRVIFYRTRWGENHFYNHIYHTWMNLAVYFLLPFLVLLVFNLLMLLALRRAKAQGLSAVATDKHGRAKRERKLTIMVLCMTGIFFLCELFPAISFILTTDLNHYNQCSIGCNRFAALADTIIMVNAAINFAIYCATGKKFRDVFRQIFCTRLASGSTNSSHSTGYSNSNSNAKQNPGRRQH